MIERLKQVLRDERAASAVEYGVILGVIVVAMVAGLTALGNQNASQWAAVSGKISTAVAQAGS